MTRYDYLEAIKSDVLEAISERYSVEETALRLLNDRADLEEELNDLLWNDDSVTGNASGSYTFSTYRAEEYIAHNLDLLAEAVEEFGGDIDVLKDGAEACDVTIRCYLLGQAIADALDELESDDAIIEAQEAATNELEED